MSLNIKACLLIFLSFFSIVCSGRSGSKPAPQNKLASQTIPDVKIKKVVFYLENSESMFGFVNSITDYVEVISELAEMPEFVKDKVPGDFYFINGTTPTLTFIGNNPALLKNKLTRDGFRCGDITNSNLNGMFQVALKNASNDVITLLISDGIYDIGGTGVTSLVTEGKGTRSRFINRLMAGDLQTIIIKLNSQFSGDYFYSSKKGKITINGRRPYYIWIFGNSRLLNTYFPNEYITTKLRGYENMARFMKPGTTKVQYQATADKSTGTFKFDRSVPNRLNNAKSDSHGLGFQFSIAVDYSKLPFPEQFLTSPENYQTNNNYTIVSIKRPTGKIYSVAFTPTHLITVNTMKNPAGQLEISLVNNVPAWIRSTQTDSEDNIQQDKTHTFGFSYLTDGMVQAYESVSEEKSIASFKIDIH
jgi:hypothetical protein